MTAWQILLSAFTITLLAELGCFVRSLALVEQFGGAPLVCAGTLAANVLLLIPLFFGGAYLRAILPPLLTRWIAGCLLIGLGGLILVWRDL